MEVKVDIAVTHVARNRLAHIDNVGSIGIGERIAFQLCTFSDLAFCINSATSQSNNANQILTLLDNSNLQQNLISVILNASSLRRRSRLADQILINANTSVFRQIQSSSLLCASFLRCLVINIANRRTVNGRLRFHTALFLTNRSHGEIKSLSRRLALTHQLICLGKGNASCILIRGFRLRCKCSSAHGEHHSSSNDARKQFLQFHCNSSLVRISKK